MKKNKKKQPVQRLITAWILLERAMQEVHDCKVDTLEWETAMHKLPGLYEHFESLSLIVAHAGRLIFGREKKVRDVMRAHGFNPERWLEENHINFFMG